MIESTFCFLSGVGFATEQKWWKLGLSNWHRFLSHPDVPGVGRSRKAFYDRDLALAEQQYHEGNARFFARHLASRHQWRLYQWLRPKAVYLDIETDSFGQVTVVGLYGRGTMTSLIRGDTLTDRRLCSELGQYDLLVTFCGMGFDVPMLRIQFPRLRLDQPHVDLCPLARTVGLRGGLKSIETAIGIARRNDLVGMDGSDAVRWWNRWRHSRDAGALERVLAYNEADCVNLEPLADWLYCRLAQRYHAVVPELSAGAPF
jgi:uncharacterized protein YprB with RNaseH-like and TPR domain